MSAHDDLQAKLASFCALEGLNKDYFVVEPHPANPAWSVVAVESNPSDYVVDTQLAIQNFTNVRALICGVLGVSFVDTTPR